MTDAVREALEAALREIESRFGELLDDDPDVLAAGIAAFLRALPGMQVALVTRGTVKFSMGESARGSCMPGEDLAAAVEQAAKEPRA